MRYRYNRSGDAGGIKKKSFSITFAMHFAAIFFLFAAPWKKPATPAYEVFAVQVIDMPRVQTPEATPPPVPEIIPEKPKPVVERPPAVRRERTPEQPAPPAEKPPAFSTEKFRETLMARIDTTPRTARETSTAEPLPVQIERVESSLLDIRMPETSITIPQWYITLVQSRIKENWAPLNLLGTRATTVSFRIARNGVINHIVLEKSSGSSAFDRTVLQAVEATKNLPEFPAEISRRHLDIVIEFKTEG